MGDLGVGKTSLIKQYVFKTYGESITSKVCAKECLKYVQFTPMNGMGTVNVRLSIRDIGLIRHPRELEGFMLDSIDGILLVCDLSRQDTLLNFDLWLDQIKNIPNLNAIRLVGNKSDIPPKEREIDIKDLEEYAADLNTTASITSAKTGEGVDDIFANITRATLSLELGEAVGVIGGSSEPSPPEQQYRIYETVGPSGADHAVPPQRVEYTKAQRMLKEMRAKHAQRRSGGGSRNYIDPSGNIHLKYNGSCYLIKEERAEKSFGAFAKLLEDDHDGLCIARQYPDEIRELYDIGSIPVYWLTRSGTEQTHLSVNLSRMSSFIKKFIDENESPVVMLEGLEYLIIQNDFMSVLKFIQLVNEFIRMKRACFIVPIDPDVLESRDLSQLEREMVVIDT